MIRKITKVAVDSAKPQDKDWFLWDTELKGFGLKISKGGTKSYVLKYRYGSGRRAPTRRMTIGRHGSPWTPDEARAEAKRLLGLVAMKQDPAYQKQEDKKQPTVSELCDDYLKNGCGTKKPSTIATDKGRVKRHIKPLLGRKRVKDVTKKDIIKFRDAVAIGKTAIDVKTGHRGRAIVKGGKGTASRTLGLLGAIFSYAIDNEVLDKNPVHGVKKFADKKNERFLTPDELIRLGTALDNSSANPMAVAILKLLIFTGARKGEMEELKWSDVDFDNKFIKLGDAKTGHRIVRLSAGALQVLSERSKMKGSDFVFPAMKGDGFYQGTPKAWRIIRQSAGLENVRLHDLRHSFASIAVSGGASLPIIGALLGHKNAATTQRYAHLMDDPIKTTNERVGEVVEAHMGVKGRVIV